ncbi:GNAT family N-acetyltransferase [Streptomyces sp. NPDC059567]|uniref:GNAT family N-acetyltransferase n=1 Tax=Streptomyces sp. NPDC059567 TaxID=3346867 RepID=UPI0036A94D0C
MATVDGSVVGMMVLDGEDLDQLHLDRAWQGQGIGDRLVGGWVVAGPEHSTTKLFPDSGHIRVSRSVSAVKTPTRPI